jgi:hypothetical protein
MDLTTLAILAQASKPSSGSWVCCLVPVVVVGVIVLVVLKTLEIARRKKPGSYSIKQPATPPGSLPQVAQAPPPLSPLPFKRKDYFFSKAEASFFLVLRQVIGDTHVIFPHVRLVDLLWLPRQAGNRLSLLNTVTAKHVDFVLCDARTFSPQLVIELDDSSHDRADRQERDEYVDQVLKDAGLPLLRVPASFGYNMAALAEAIKSRLKST